VRLEDARNFFQFLQDHEEEESWLVEKQRICKAGISAKDLRAVLSLQQKHKVSLCFVGCRATVTVAVTANVPGTWCRPNSSELVMKGQNNGVQICAREGSKSQTLRFMNIRPLLCRINRRHGASLFLLT
jgi:hypothetical protein